MAYSKPISLGDYQDSALSRFEGQDDGCIGVGPDNLGLGAQLGPFFDAVVNALVQHPIPYLPIAVGENGATAASSTLFWAYNKLTGLTVEATPGYLTPTAGSGDTAVGNGGFSLHVAVNGDWSLTFDGTGTTIGHHAGGTVPTPPATTSPPYNANTVMTTAVNPGLSGDKWSLIGPNQYNVNATGAPLPPPPSPPSGAYAGHITFDDTNPDGLDTVQGGVGDYMIGGGGVGPGIARTYSDGLALGNCALYSNSNGPVLVDGENGNGYGGSADGNVLVNINQLRGAAGYSNVLIGSTTGTDLKSGGNNSILISTGGDGYELRPDGSGNLLVSTVGADRVLFDPAKFWSLGDQNTMIGFNPAHGDYLDLSLMTNDFTPGVSNINKFVRLVETSSGESVMFNAAMYNGTTTATGWVDVLDMDLTHGLTAQGLYNSHNLVMTPTV